MSKRPARGGTIAARHLADFARRLGADTALLALGGEASGDDRSPRLAEALPWMEALHDALVRGSDEASAGAGPSSCLTARTADDELIPGHRHATLIPLVIDEKRDRVDHMLVHAPMGFDGPAVGALMRVRRLWAKELPDLDVALVGLGRREDFRETVAQLGVSTVWTSVTPFVPSRFMKPRGVNSLEGQVQAELSSRGLPAAASVEVELEGGQYVAAEEFWGRWSAAEDAGFARRWRRWRMERMDSGKRPPIVAGFGLRLRFEPAVEGPVALGYAAHFGLGGFRVGE
ncbi:type I-U CRISPR-associated protein Csb2 [Polyangium sp. 15x6]|nr:type I-U CRISPR-associated protein Csb2 [Polyangium sp. 15x6]MDI3290991.1 type I-U CRISPR-associated protein Csb2 [Polyangium sp. 15x6]